MNTLNQIKELFLEHGLALLAAVVLVAALAGNIYFYATNIAPALTAREQINLQMRDARDALVESRRIQNEPSATVQARVNSAQSKLASVISPLASITQTNVFIDSLYQYADDSHIKITDLQTQSVNLQSTPTPIVATPTRALPTLIPSSLTGAVTPIGQAAATPTRSILATSTLTRLTPTLAPTLAPEQDAFYAKTLNIQATGSFHQLNEFVSRIKELNTKPVVLNSVNIAGTESRATLNLEIALYVSSFATGNGEIGAPTPTNTIPPPTQQPPVPPPPQPSATPVPPSTTTPIPSATPTPTISATPTASLTVTPSQRTIVYTVAPSDTLFSIARRFNTTPEAIIEANRLPSSFLRVGQLLYIPVR